MKTIMHIFPSTEKIGPIKAMINLIRNMDPAQYKVLYVALNKKGWGRHTKDAADYQKELEEVGLEVIDLDLEQPFDIFQGPSRLKRLIRERNVDIVHTHMLRPHIYGRLAAHSLKVPVVSTIHNQNPWVMSPRPDHVLMYMADKFTMRYVETFFAVADNVKDFILKHESIPESKIQVVYNSIATEGSQEISSGERQALRTELGIQPQDQAFVTVARCDTQKDPFTLIEGVRIAAGQDPRIRLFYVGSGPLEEDMKSMVRKNGIEKNFVMTGERNDVLRILPAFDVFVLPSIYEGLSNALLEAMASGLPSLVSDIPSNKYIIENGKTGRLFPVGDVHALAKALLALVQERDQWLTMGEQARAVIKEKYDASKLTKKYVAEYDRILSQNKT